MKISHLILLLLAIFTSACTSQLPTLTPTLVSTLTPTKIVSPSATKTLIPSKTPTITVSVTKTATPTFTSTPSPSFTPSLQASVTLTNTIARVEDSDSIVLPNEPETVIWSPDGKLIYVGLQDGVIAYDVASQEQVFYVGNNVRIRSVAVHPDGQSLALGLDSNDIVIINAITGELIRTLEEEFTWIQSLTYSLDGKLFVVDVNNGALDVYEGVSATPLKRILTADNYADGNSAICRDGSFFAAPNITLWNISTGKMYNTLEGHSAVITDMEFSRDDKKLASTSTDRTVKIWDVSTGEMLFNFEGHTGWVWAVAFHPDGRKVASAGIGETIILWDTTSGQAVSEFYIGVEWVKALAFSPDGTKLASVDSDGHLKIWKMPDNP